jgi:enoyl-CoA hydratase/carnithine racemase
MTQLTDKIIVNKSNGIGWIILNQPEKKNAISFEMWEAIPRITEQFCDDDDVRVVILTGQGDQAFSSGADISQFEKKRSSKSTTDEYNLTVKAAVAALDQLAKPSIAMIQGYCIGGGTSVAVHCDIRIAADNAVFAIPAARLGLAYRWEDIYPLVQLIGPSFTRELLYTGSRFNSKEAIQMGLVNRVVPVAELKSYVTEYAARIAANAPLTIHSANRTVAEALKDPEQRDLAEIETLAARCFDSDDYREGRQAFSEKRKPRFKGR